MNTRLPIAFLYGLAVVPLFAQSNVFPTPTGNVGIGTTAPDARLTFGSSSGDQIKTVLPNGITGAVVTHYNGDPFFIMRGKDSWNERVRISASAGATSYINSGFFGLGNTAPTAVLDITNAYSSGVDSIRLSYNDGTLYMLGIKPYVVAAGNVGYVFQTTNGSATKDALVLTGAGKVGIGRTSPYTKLDVLVTNADGMDPLRVQGEQNNIWFTLNSDQAVYFSTAQTASAGSPNLNSVILTTRGQYWDSAAGTARSVDSTMQTVVTGNNQYRLAFKTGNTERFAINQAGYVGIGTSNPTELLSVKGKIRAQEVIVETTGWADYVLSRDYQLTPLSEVEAHIDANGTLPGIPSAKKVDQEGISVGEMQAKLLEKVEEITLHLIVLSKENAQLKAKVEQLEAAQRL
ncbi:MAG: hypothetical protein SFV32_13875 [Opitutaceae bacterium]|nr:hypothetical protein [Opitutaceae bacterium]